jgi:hypothetical protein
MNGSKTARFARSAAPFVAVAAALGAGCDVTSVVGYEESALGALECSSDAPVARCDQVTCVIRDLEAAQVGSTALAVDDIAAYYLREASAIVKTPVGGGAMVELAKSDMGVFHMAVDATHLFWSEFGRRIFRVAKAGGPAEVVADIDGHPGVLALDETHVYATLTDTNQLVMAPKVPGKGTFLPQQAPIWLATDATHVYWINQGNVPVSGELVRAPLGDLARSEVLAEGIDSPVTLALSGTDAYFVAASQLFRFPKRGGALELLRSVPDETKSMATYSNSIYLTGIAGLLRIRDGESVTLDTRTTLALAIACSGVFSTGWLVPALLKYAP